MNSVVFRELLDDINSQMSARLSNTGIYYKTIVDKELPESVTGEFENLQKVILLILEDAAENTKAGKIELKISANLAVNLLEFVVCDTRDTYDASSERMKSVNSLLESMNSKLLVESVDKLGASSFFIFQYASASDVSIGEYSFASSNQVKRGIRIKDVDVEKGIQYVQGDEASYIRFLVEYIKSAKNFSTNLEKSYMETDWNIYRITAHSIKSGSYTIGADRLGDLAKELEYAARDEDINVIGNKHHLLVQNLSDIVEAVGNTLEELGVEIETKADSLIDKLLNAIYDFEQEEALTLLDEMIDCGEIDSDTSARIKESLEELNYLEAENIVEQYKDK